MNGSSQVVDCCQFLHRAQGPIFDVRSPCEFSSGHIPGSYSLPLFSDVERAIIGTVYKQRGHDAAVQLGLEIVGPKLGEMSKSIREVMKKFPEGACRVTCFRGGMRSRSVQWLCQFLGLTAVRLDGGYKAFRHHVLDTFCREFHFIVIGGATGSGKTSWISLLKQQGFQAIDLEELAGHRGSAFGLVPGAVQPTTEQFENILAEQLWKMNPSAPIFLEDESRRIGSCTIPKEIYDRMDRSKLLWLDVSKQDRIHRILDSYGKLPQQWAIECTRKLAKRLGGARVEIIVRAIEQGQIEQAVELLLDYYDQAYLYSRSRHPRDHLILTPSELKNMMDGSSSVSEDGIPDQLRIPSQNEGC